MDEHRLVHPNEVIIKPFDPPFSSFNYVDENYGSGNAVIRRLFSLARSHSARTFMIENIEPSGIISDENDEIKQYVADYEMRGLHRISFWTSTPEDSVCQEENCVGYAILKHDKSVSRNYDEWHAFEAVFKKYPHPHNCVPNPMQYEVVLGGVKIRLCGLLYAQQNELNKSCAQVALRSVISRKQQGDVSYRQINDFAKRESINTFDPANGLNTKQIRAVLVGFRIGFRDFDYTQNDDHERESHPYQKFIYSGIESGSGALLGFRLTGPSIQEAQSHIIPFYGHTFNKDTWSPEADIAYFRVGENILYLPSENWTSSFLGHDDNFGPNFCVPRLYIQRDQVDYVVELLKPRITFSGAQAEALSLQFLYSVLTQIDTSGNVWLKRLTEYFHSQLVVLRAISVDRDKYIQHLSDETDWSQNSEEQQVINVLSERLPQALWVVEISVPQLFPANERKIGEIVLNGEIEIDKAYDNHSTFLFARLPGTYFFENSDEPAKEDFVRVPSKLTSHLPVIRL